MLTSYLLLGLFGEGGGSLPGPLLTVPTERIVRLTKTSSFVAASFSIDPTDTLNFELNLLGLLELDEGFTSVSFAVLPAATALGFSIPESGSLGLAEIAPGRVQFWPVIDDAEQSRTAWVGQGTLCSFEVTALTDSTPPRRWQRTVSIRVAQK